MKYRESRFERWNSSLVWQFRESSAQTYRPIQSLLVILLTSSIIYQVIRRIPNCHSLLSIAISCFISVIARASSSVKDQLISFAENWLVSSKVIRVRKLIGTSVGVVTLNRILEPYFEKHELLTDTYASVFYY